MVPTLPGIRPHPLAPCCAHVDVDGRPCLTSIAEVEACPRERVVEWDLGDDPFASAQLDATIRAPHVLSCTCPDARGTPTRGIGAFDPIYVTCGASRGCRAWVRSSVFCEHANECPAACPCDSRCACRQLGAMCGPRIARAT